jgi:hypothetical protein
VTEPSASAPAAPERTGRDELRARSSPRAMLDTNVPIAAHSDDNAILACAYVGRASHIVTYDPHFGVPGGAYGGIPIVDGLHFLYIVRGDQPPAPVC